MSNFTFALMLISTQAQALVNLNVIPKDSPQSKVCFFSEPEFKGQYFCMPIGAQEADLKPSGWNDRIRSIGVEGHAHVTVYRDSNYRGASISVEQSVARLSELPGQWDKEISGFIAYKGRRFDK